MNSLIDTLLAEHRLMAEAQATVRRDLLALAAQQRETLDPTTIAHLADCYRRHIAREEETLLPLARRLLMPEDVAEISRSMTARRLPPPDASP